MTPAYRSGISNGMKAALTLSVLSLLFSACSPFPDRSSARPPAIYLLEWHAPPPLKQASALHCGTLTVSPPSAVPGYNGTGMAYVTKDYRLDYFAKHRWADTPARMLRPILVNALAHSGLFSAVISGPAPIVAPLRLDTEIERLQQVFAQGTSHVEFSLRVQLIDMNRHRLLLNHVIDVKLPAGSGPYTGVIASNRAIAQMIDSLIADLSRTLARANRLCTRPKA